MDRLHLYYDMQLITFGIDRDMNLVVPIPSVYPTIHLETFNSISTVPVPILYRNNEAQSYMHL